jgi:hypothetical protein
LQGLTICLFFVLFDPRNNNPSPPPSSAREPSIQTQSEVIDLQSVTAKTINSIISESVSYHKYNLTGVYRGNWIESIQNTLVNHLKLKKKHSNPSQILNNSTKQCSEREKEKEKERERQGAAES